MGADAIGLVFYPPSPRAVSVERAAEIVRDLPPFVTVVGLFVDPDRDEVADILAAVRLDLLQFHGDESPEACSEYGCPFIKAVRMRDGIDLAALREHYGKAAGLLLDSYQKGVPGGTGATFDWERIPRRMAGEIILAGGLSVDNVEDAIRQVRPMLLMSVAGVEQGKGIKDGSKIAAFMRGVELANQ